MLKTINGSIKNDLLLGLNYLTLCVNNFKSLLLLDQNARDTYATVTRYKVQIWFLVYGEMKFLERFDYCVNNYKYCISILYNIKLYICPTIVISTMQWRQNIILGHYYYFNLMPIYPYGCKAFLPEQTSLNERFNLYLFGIFYLMSPRYKKHY